MSWQVSTLLKQSQWHLFTQCKGLLLPLFIFVVVVFLGGRVGFVCGGGGCMGQRSMLGDFLISLHLTFETGSLSEPKAHWFSRLARWQVPGSILTCLPHAGITDTWHVMPNSLLGWWDQFFRLAWQALCPAISIFGVLSVSFVSSCFVFRFCPVLWSSFQSLPLLPFSVICSTEEPSPNLQMVLSRPVTVTLTYGCTC